MKRDWLTIETSPWSLGFLLGVILLLSYTSELPGHINTWLYDQTVSSWPASVDERVAIVAIDEPSLRQLGRWPWHRSTHAQLIDKLAVAGAETVILDILLPESGPGDNELARAITHHGNVVLPVYLSATDTEHLMAEVLPAPQLANAASALGHVHVELESDGVARGLYLYYGLAQQLWPPLALASELSPRPPGQSQVPHYVNVREDYRRIPLVGGAGTVPAYSYSKVLETPANELNLKGKTVLVGATAAGFGDILPTPFSGLSRPMPGVEFHANIASAFYRNSLIVQAPTLATGALAILVILLLATLLPRLRPASGLVMTLAILVTLLAAHSALLVWFRFEIGIANALLLPVAAIPLASGLRLATANRFFNRQLAHMATIPRLSLPDPAHRHPQLLLKHLRVLLKPEGWLLAEGKDLTELHNMSLAEALPTPVSGHWYHQQNQSWIRLVRGNTEYLIGLTLPDDLSREVNQHYLDRLLLEAGPYSTARRGSRERLSARIERVRSASEKLEEMQGFIRRSFEHMPDGIIVTDELGVIRFANARIERWFGEPMPSLSGMPLASLLESRDKEGHTLWHEILAETLTLQERRTADLTVNNRDFLIHLAPFLLPDTGQQGLIANISNISNLKDQQRQYREAIDFISHDVRSPLVSQLALIEQLKRDPEQVTSAHLDQLGRLAKRSYQLAEEFVQLARAEQLTETRFYECELLAIVENARDSVCEQALEKSVEIHLSGTEDLWLRGNAELLERAIINLLTNAVQYSPAGSLITVQVYQAAHLACVAITDEGTGIDAGELPRLFDRYHRQKRTETGGIHGTGLGLSFVKTVMEKHHGEVLVDSVPGDGATFTLKLPISDPMLDSAAHQG